MGVNEESVYDKLLANYSNFHGWSERGRDAFEQGMAALVKEGRSREQAINELAERQGVTPWLLLG